jgi:hypothetical protein
MSRPLLSSHSTPIRSACEAVACARRVSVVVVHLLTPINGDGKQAILLGQMCALHAQELQDELRAISEVRPPLYVRQGGRRG